MTVTELNLILGCATMVLCLAIQCVVVSVLLRLLFALERKRLVKTTLMGMSALLIVVMLVMLSGNILQIALWAGLFVFFGEFEHIPTAFYHSMVNFTTLGYGDLVMSEKARLLGALEAANGVMMFGLTTGVLFTVLHKLSQRMWNERVVKSEAPGEPPSH